MKRITQTYYRLLDFVQRNWHRFRATEVGKATVWFTPRLLRWSWWLVKWTVLFFTAFTLIMYASFFFVFLVCTGNGKAAVNSFTKITLVVVGLFTAKQLVTHKAEVAKAIEAVTK